MLNNRKWRLGIDLDGVVYQYVDTLRKWAHIEHGVNLNTMQEPTTWNWYEEWGWTQDKYLKIALKGIRHPYIFRYGSPYPTAMNVLESLHRDYQIIFITSRSGFGEEPDLCRDSTLNWLKDYDIAYDGVIFSDDKTRRGVDIMLDDAPYQYEKMKAVGEPIKILTRSWNKGFDAGDDRIDDWNQFESYVREALPV